jgi:uncharacterized protein (TIGR02284 family)
MSTERGDDAAFDPPRPTMPTRPPEMTMNQEIIPDPTNTSATASQKAAGGVQDFSSDAGLGRKPSVSASSPEADRKVVATLNELIQTSMDGAKGFALAADDSKDPSLKNVFMDGEQSCRTAAEELQDEVRILGGNPEIDGSMKAAVHRGWISLKSAASARDSKAILEECERGEDYAKAKYGQALKQDLPPAVRELVERQYQGVVATHDRIRDLRNQHRSRPASA